MLVELVPRVGWFLVHQLGLAWHLEFLALLVLETLRPMPVTRACMRAWVSSWFHHHLLSCHAWSRTEAVYIHYNCCHYNRPYHGGSKSRGIIVGDFAV